MPRMIAAVADEAIGRTHRRDPVTVHSGGPAGNARLTAWTGLLLLALIAVELVTLLDVRGLISWHIVVGTLLVPVGLLKTALTTWRFARYYTGHRPYQIAGPPPTLLRFLGPLVIVATLGVLGSGLALIALGPDASRRVIFSALGQDVDTLTLHQALFIAFAVITGLHVLARLLPAITLASGRLSVGSGSQVPGGRGRIAILGTTLAVAAITAALVFGASTSWTHDHGQRFDRRPGTGAPPGPRP